MEFEEMKKIWDAQANESLYVINEAAMYRIVTSKKEKSMKITNITELLSIFANIGSGIIIFWIAYPNIYMIVLAIWMLMVGVWCAIARIRRQRADKVFDRSMLNDLQYAIDVAAYQVRFSSLIRWNIFPIAVLVILSVNQSIVMMIGFLLFFTTAFYVSRWEHNYYKRRRDHLEKLKENLTNF